MSYINRYLSFFSYKHANFNADPFIFTASILNYKSDFKSLDAYFIILPFAAIALIMKFYQIINLLICFHLPYDDILYQIKSDSSIKIGDLEIKPNQKISKQIFFFLDLFRSIY